MKLPISLYEYTVIFLAMTQTNFNCTSNEWCYALGINAYCNSNGTCVCSLGFEMDENYVCQGKRAHLSHRLI